MSVPSELNNKKKVPMVGITLTAPKKYFSIFLILFTLGLMGLMGFIWEHHNKCDN
jgi:hypothetical protein